MRRDARELAFQVIFASLFTKQEDEDVFSSLKKQEDVMFSKSIISAYITNFEILTNLLEKNLNGYELSRVYKTDLALLYSALAEIIYVGSPKQVVINETLEIAKKYSTEKSFKFINGVLSAILRETN